VREDARTQFVDPRAATAKGDQPVPPAVLAPSPDDEGQTRVVDPISPTAVVQPSGGGAETRFVDPETGQHHDHRRGRRGDDHGLPETDRKFS